MKNSGEINENLGDLFVPPIDNESLLEWLKEVYREGAVIPRIQEGTVSLSDYVISADFGTENERIRAINMVKKIDNSSFCEEEKMRAAERVLRKGVHEGPVSETNIKYMINRSVIIADSYRDGEESGVRVMGRKEVNNVVTMNESHYEILDILSPFMPRDPDRRAKCARFDIEVNNVPVVSRLKDTSRTLYVEYERKTILAELILRGMISDEDLYSSDYDLPLSVNYKLTYFGREKDNPAFRVELVVPIEVEEELARHSPDTLSKLENLAVSKSFSIIQRYGPSYDFILTQLRPVTYDLDFIAQCSQEVLRQSQYLVHSGDKYQVTELLGSRLMRKEANGGPRFWFQSWCDGLKRFVEDEIGYAKIRDRLANTVSKDFELAADELVITISQARELRDGFMFSDEEENYFGYLFSGEYLNRVVAYIATRLSVDKHLVDSENVQRLLRTFINLENLSEKARSVLLSLL